MSQAAINFPILRNSVNYFDGNALEFVLTVISTKAAKFLVVCNYCSSDIAAGLIAEDSLITYLPCLVNDMLGAQFQLTGCVVD